MGPGMSVQNELFLKTIEFFAAANDAISEFLLFTRTSSEILEIKQLL